MGKLTNQLAGNVLAVSILGNAWAQTRDAGAATQLQEVVVTAQRRSEDIQKVPLSVTAVDEQVLANRHINAPSQLTFVAPSLQVEVNNNSAVAAAFSVRGVGTLTFSPFIESSVGLMVDDVAMARPETAALDMYDIKDVEVLNGPQGMLFGINTSAGLVKIATNPPKLGTYSVDLDGEYGHMTTPGSGNEYVVHGMVNIPLTSDSALRIAGSFHYLDPLVQNVFTTVGQDARLVQGGMRLKYLWAPDGPLQVALTGDYSYERGTGQEELTYRSVVPGVVASANAALGIVAGPDNVRMSSEALSTEHFGVGGVQAHVTYKFANDSTLTDILAWREYEQYRLLDEDFTQINIVDLLLNNPLIYSQLSNELRYASSSNQPLIYQVGLYLMSARNHVGDLEEGGDLGLGEPPPGFLEFLGTHASQTEHVRSIAPYGQATYRATDKLSVTTGARFTYDEVDNAAVVYSFPAIIQILQAGVVPKTTATANNVSWRASLQYQVAPNVMAYGTVARGYKGPGFNLFSSVSVRPETSQDYEVGLKTTWLNRRVLLNLSLYDEAFHDFQAQTFVATPPFFETLNAGNLKSRGFEVETQVLVAGGLRFRANVSYASAYFSSFIGDQCYAGEPAGASPLPNVCYGGHSNSSGNRLPDAPRWSGTMSADYAHALTDRLTWTGELSVYSRSGVNYSTNADPNQIQGAYSLVGANLGLQSGDGNWTAVVFCRNCLDRRVAMYIVPQPVDAADYLQAFGPDSFRTIGVSFSRHF